MQQFEARNNSYIFLNSDFHVLPRSCVSSIQRNLESKGISEWNPAIPKAPRRARAPGCPQYTSRHPATCTAHNYVLCSMENRRGKSIFHIITSSIFTSACVYIINYDRAMGRLSDIPTCTKWLVDDSWSRRSEKPTLHGIGHLDDLVEWTIGLFCLLFSWTLQGCQLPCVSSVFGFKVVLCRFEPNQT